MFWVRTIRRRKAYLLGTPSLAANVLPILQQCKDLLNSGLLFSQLLHFQTLTAALCLFLDVLQCLFDEFNILDPQLVADDVQISHWVHVALDVNDLCIVEASHHLEDGIDSADV